MLFDGTYFHKNGCLVVLMGNKPQSILESNYISKENYADTYTLLIHLRAKGLMPRAVTVDGHKQVIDAFKSVWPNIKIQRCLFHIQKQGLQWLRTYPKTEAGKELRYVLKYLTSVKTKEVYNQAIKEYVVWHNTYKDFIKRLPRNSVANIDLKRTTSLINNALPDMYHFLKDHNIDSTTNLLENFFSQLKHKYRCHRGLTEKHKVAYLKWFCYFKYHKK